jgi:hypothetical protein
MKIILDKQIFEDVIDEINQKVLTLSIRWVGERVFMVDLKDYDGNSIIEYGPYNQLDGDVITFPALKLQFEEGDIQLNLP